MSSIETDQKRIDMFVDAIAAQEQHIHDGIASGKYDVDDGNEDQEEKEEQLLLAQVLAFTGSYFRYYILHLLNPIFFSFNDFILPNVHRPEKSYDSRECCSIKFLFKSQGLVSL